MFNFGVSCFRAAVLLKTCSKLEKQLCVSRASYVNTSCFQYSVAYTYAVLPNAWICRVCIELCISICEIFLNAN